MHRSFVSLLVLGAAVAAAPAQAHNHGGGAMPPPPPQGVYQGTWQGGSWTGQWVQGPQGAYPMPYPAQPMSYPAPDPRMQDMMERCASYRPDSGTGGAVIGGLVGGVVGNRVASGNRVLGTVAGAAVGAVAGRAIDKAEDAGRERECRDFWASQPPAGAYGYPGYGYGYFPAYVPMGYVMVPVPQAPAKPCVETKTVTYEYVTTPRRRYIPARPRDKRVKEKRIYVGS